MHSTGASAKGQRSAICGSDGKRLTIDRPRVVLALAAMLSVLATCAVAVHVLRSSAVLLPVSMNSIAAGRVGRDPFVPGGIVRGVHQGVSAYGTGARERSAALPAVTPGRRDAHPAGAFARRAAGTSRFAPGAMVCDVERLLSVLRSSPRRERAFAGVLGWPVDRLRARLEALRPGFLLHDTVVVNHGYAQGRVLPRPQTLAAGTAVLVDADAVPRVRCECGNPLLALEKSPAPAEGKQGDGPEKGLAAPTVHAGSTAAAMAVDGAQAFPVDFGDPPRGEALPLAMLVLSAPPAPVADEAPSVVGRAPGEDAGQGALPVAGIERPRPDEAALQPVPLPPAILLYGAGLAWLARLGRRDRPRRCRGAGDRAGPGHLKRRARRTCA
jgi:hypothetical protein